LRAFWALVLNDLCVIEKQAEGSLPAVTALWLCKTRRNAAEQSAAVGAK
jgi:hypothetical protein